MPSAAITAFVMKNRGWGVGSASRSALCHVAGPEGPGLVVSYYAGARESLFPQDADDGVIFAAATSQRPDVVLLLPTRRMQRSQPDHYLLSSSAWSRPAIDKSTPSPCRAGTRFRYCGGVPTTWWPAARRPPPRPASPGRSGRRRALPRLGWPKPPRQSLLHRFTLPAYLSLHA